jgi:hypothetical protein
LLRGRIVRAFLDADFRFEAIRTDIELSCSARTFFAVHP